MPPTSTEEKGGDAGGYLSGARKRRKHTPGSRPTPTMITRSRAAAHTQSRAGTPTRSLKLGKQTASRYAKRKMMMDARRQEDAAAASASAATAEGYATAASPSAAAGEASSTTSSPVRCPMIPEVINYQDSSRVVDEPFDSALVDAYMEENEKYTAKLERHQNLWTLSENWATTCLDHQVMLSIRESATDTVFKAAESVFGLSSYIDGDLLARSSGFLIEWDNKNERGTILTSANLLCTKSPPVDLWSCPCEYDPNVEVLVHLLDDTVVKGKLLNYHGYYNIALFEVVMNQSTELLVWTESVDYGQEVFLVGRDEKLHLNSSYGRVKCTDPGLFDQHHYMYVNCGVAKFGAGGPAIDTNGKVAVWSIPLKELPSFHHQLYPDVCVCGMISSVYPGCT